ncbi:plectin-like, partial [Meleagris gallopavo]|uniref:plectin-like n=1 Tax=Meleagris gallopavo TaxID=9103 RepID=UPI000549B847
MRRQQSDRDAEKLRGAIADLEREKEGLKREAELLQRRAEEMEVAQQAQLRQETQSLQESFLHEKDALLQREKFIEEEKAKLEKLFQDEVDKAQSLKAEQERQQQEMEQEKQQLKAMLDEAKRQQEEAEESVRRKQEELQQLQKQRQKQEKLLEEENRKLRERLQQLQEEQRSAVAPTREMMIQTDAAPQPHAVPNGRHAVDGPEQNGEPEFAFQGIRQKVSAQQLAAAGVLSGHSLGQLAEGKVSVEELARRDDVRTFLQGRSCIAGLLTEPGRQKMSIYEAMKKRLLGPGTALVLLEAQAATGFMLDPVRNARLSVNEAVRDGLVGPELHNKLLSAERAVTGYKDPYTGDKISLFQAMQKELIVREHGIRLLEAQIATGGIIDPVHSHRIPVEAAYKRGLFDEEMNRVLSDPSDDTKGFLDPNTQENLTYLQLMERCVEDPETGLLLLPLSSQAGAELLYSDQEAKDVFKKATVSAPFGKFQGKTVSIWEIINSEYFTEDQRRELIQQYRGGKVTVEKIIKIVITVVEEGEKKRQMLFEGLRAPVPAAELLESRIIDKDVYNRLRQGKASVANVAQSDAVRPYLSGTDAVAGVLVESSGERLSFYEAQRKNLLKPEVALALLEAQAAAGFIVEPTSGRLYTVDEAVKAEVVGPE